MASSTQNYAMTLINGVPTRKAISYRHEQGSGSTSWTVTHNLGFQYCKVEVIIDDESVIPDSIVFDNTNQLTVNFSESKTGIVIVGG